jgi:general stress protein 26
MSSARSGDATWQVLADTHTGVFTTLRADGMPIALPVWFVCLDERIYVDSVARLKKVARIARDPRVCFLVESGEHWAELRGVQLTGVARVVTEPVLVDRVGRALRAKYDAFRGDRSAMPGATRAHYEMEHLTIEIEPDAPVFTWDYSSLS